MKVKDLLKHYNDDKVRVWLNDNQILTFERDFFEEFNDIIPVDILNKKICNFNIHDDHTINIWED